MSDTLRLYVKVERGPDGRAGKHLAAWGWGVYAGELRLDGSTCWYATRAEAAEATRRLFCAPLPVEVEK